MFSLFGLGLGFFGMERFQQSHFATSRVPELGLESPSSSLPEGSREVPNLNVGEWIAGPNRARKRLAFAFLVSQFCINMFCLQHR